MKFATLIPTLLLIATIDADCQNEAKLPSIKNNIRNELLAVQMAQDSALKLIPRLRNWSTAEAAADEIWKGIATDQFKLLGISTTLGADGHRIFAGCYEEIRYPTEFYAPSPHQNFAQPVTPLGPSLPPYFMQDIDVPIAWEARYTGLELEMEPTLTNASDVFHVSRGKNTALISLSIVPRLVELPQMKRFLAAPEKQEERAQYEQPLFRVSRVETSLDAPSGKWQLIYVSVVPGQRSQMKLFLLRCTALPLRK